MALGHRRSWKITVHAKVSNLYIKLKATVKLPSGKFQRLLKLDKLLIGVDSKSSESRILIQQQTTFRSRILSLVKKHIGRRRSKSKTRVGFKMPDASSFAPYSYLVLETGHKSRHLGRLELSCAGVLGVGFGYLLAELKRSVRINFNPSWSSFAMVCLVLFVLWLHRFRFLCAMLISVVSFLLLEMDTVLEHLDLGKLS